MAKRHHAVIEQFDRDSESYLSKNVRPEMQREQSRLFNLSGGKSYRRGLDLGCGPGTMSNEMLAICDEVWGVDPSERMIAIATERRQEISTGHRVHFEVGSAETLRFEDETFDVVFCVGVLRYLDSWENGLREIHRVLKRNGTLVTTFYYRYSLQWWSMVLLGRPLLPLVMLLKGRPVRECLEKNKAEPLPFSYRDFKRILPEIGFEGMELQHSGFEFYPLRRLMPSLSRRIYLSLEKRFFDSPVLGWLGSICIVKVVKR